MPKSKLTKRHKIQIVIIAVITILLSVGIIFAMIMDERKSDARKMNEFQQKYLNYLIKQEKEARYSKTLAEAKAELPNIDKIDFDQN